METGGQIAAPDPALARAGQSLCQEAKWEHQICLPFGYQVLGRWRLDLFQETLRMHTHAHTHTDTCTHVHSQGGASSSTHFLSLLVCLFTLIMPDLREALSLLHTLWFSAHLPLHWTLGLKPQIWVGGRQNALSWGFATALRDCGSPSGAAEGGWGHLPTGSGVLCPASTAPLVEGRCRWTWLKWLGIRFVPPPV